MATHLRFVTALALLEACAPTASSTPPPAPSALLAPSADVLPHPLARPLAHPSAHPLAYALAHPSAPASGKPELASPGELAELFRYIERGWSVLRRDHGHLLAIAEDPKFATPTGRWPVYLPQREDRRRIEATLQAEVPPAELARIDLRVLPAPKQLPIPEPREPGLLYLPHAYVVPGGRFNEMYGWDSYFILLGLLRDGLGTGNVELARGMVDNFLYEIEHYGMVLNANRSYYLSRSQPPLLTPMILRVYARLRDRAWLGSTLPAIEQYYRYWTRAPHLTPVTGLSRYYDLGHGPAAEVLAGERDRLGRSHYDRVRAWFAIHSVTDYDAARFYDRQRDALTELFYVADRSMRESGFDPSNRFGPFNAAVIDHDPVCLNSLLYRMEQDAAQIERILGHPRAAKQWSERAEARGRAMQRYLWDPETGLFLDYDFERRARRNYPFATTFFPLWVGLAAPEQAARLVPAALRRLEAPGGLRTSAHASGSQWDAPFGWAPLELVAVEALRAYGYHAEADRISINFLSLVLQEFVEHRAIFEKYEVEHRRSDVAPGIRFGYSSNEIGFGWTNATFATLYDALPEAKRAEVRRLGGLPLPARR